MFYLVTIECFDENLKIGRKISARIFVYAPGMSQVEMLAFIFGDARESEEHAQRVSHDYFLSPKRSIKERYLLISFFFKYANKPRL